MFKLMARSSALSRTVSGTKQFSPRFASPRFTAPKLYSTAGGSGAEGSTVPPKKKTSLLKQFYRFTVVAGLGTIGYFCYSLYDEVVLPTQAPIPKSKPKLLVLGSGWGAVGMLKTLDFENYDVTVVSSRNYFLFTPLLPSTATGLIEHRSIMEPTRAILRKKSVQSTFVEGEAIKVDPYAKKVTIRISGNSHKNQVDHGMPEYVEDIDYDKLVIGIGATTNSFGIKGVKEFGSYLKETEDAQKIRKRIMDCIEAASVPGLSKEERRRLMHAVVVGAGPTGVEFAGELHDFVYNDVRRFNPEVVKDFKVSLIEGMPQILPAGFSKNLVTYAIDTLEREQIDILTETMVTGADADNIYASRKLPNGQKEEIQLPYGLFVWAGGTGVRPLIKDLFNVIPQQASQRRGLKVDEFLRVKGVEDVWAVGDCADAGLAPTAQVASQEGVYVGQLLDRLATIQSLNHQLTYAQGEEETRMVERHLRRVAELPNFKYSHQGSLAYIGSEKALADVTWYGKNYSLSGTVTYIFWRSAYLSMCFSLRNKLLVALDWTKVLLFGRDLSRE